MVASGEVHQSESPVKQKSKSKQVKDGKEHLTDNEGVACERKRDIEEGLKLEHLPDDLYVLHFDLSLFFICSCLYLQYLGSSPPIATNAASTFTSV